MKSITKAVIPVAGYGTRMYPASRALKKELFPVVDRDGVAKAALQIVLEEAMASGIEEFCLVTQPEDEADFRRYFLDPLPVAWADKLNARDGARRETDRLKDIGRRLSFVYQHDQLGFGHAVYCAREWVGDAPFLLMLGDHLYGSATDTRCAAQLLTAQRRTGGSMLAVEPVREEELHLVGTVRGAPLQDVDGVYRVESFREKPDREFARLHLRTHGLAEGLYLGVFGLYALDAAIFDVLGFQVANDVREAGEIQFTSAMETLRASGADFYACRMHGERYDIGVPREYVRTIGALGMTA